MKPFLVIFLLGTFWVFPQGSENHPAVTFLNALNEEQKSNVLLHFEDEKKTDWHYFPSTSFSREGIAIKQLSPSQQLLLHELLKASLSESGFNTTLKIIDLENVLAELSGDYVRRDSGAYYVSFYGNPFKEPLWAWSFEGHHVSLNFTVLNGKTHLAPRFFGANPATIRSGDRKGERMFQSEEDLALEFMTSLNEEERKSALIRNSAYSDIITGNDPEVSPLQIEGIPLQTLNRTQRSLLLNLIRLHLSDRVEERFNEVFNRITSEELQDIHFGWAGEISLTAPHYYRIQGKSFLIEFDNIQNNANHIHIVWRDFDGDFGRDLIQEHYQTSHKH
ncbi:DUF3500 domain-containing protein [Hyunsoonleella sp. SJ7]|uniref:DUF3500 domain-containing protein n=1 Tax=Hyunsoonleella aquatilis TaxID=2762758 RepID=A0A923KKW3_9FLAO|nr:DUF3500 domain-containing protein [Hyunsoonleella aquatilis]MBC3757265.1 DUF3500 domain-containing protein [Hyunsoonleella aquatilis]